MTRKLLATLLLVAMLISCFSGVTMVHAEDVDLTADEEVTTPETGEEEVPEEDPEPTELSGELTELPAGEYVLVDDVTMMNTINLEGAVEIDLAGYTLTAPENAQAFTGSNYASLTVTDSSEEGTGTIQGNGTVAAYGGFMTVPYRGGFYMTGGTITGFTSTANGGVFYWGGERTIVLNDVTVTNNTAVLGGVFKGDGRLSTLTINGGTYTGNTASSTGSIMHSNWVALTINGATITGNAGKDATIYMAGSFTMNGGSISGNTLPDGETPVKAVHLNAYDYQQTADASDNGTVGDISGSAVIGDKGISLAGNRSNGNGYDAPASVATVHDLTEGASIFAASALTVPSGETTVAEAVVEGGYQYTVSDGSSVHAGWTKVTEDIETLTAGTYILDADVALTTTVTLDGNTKLCLNGHTLTAPEAARAFILPVGTSLAVCDCSEEGTGTIQGNGTVAELGGFAYVYGGTFTLESGTITGFTSSNMGGAFHVAHAQSVVNLNGGTISGCSGSNGGMIRADVGTVNFAGTTVTGNTTAGVGTVMISYGDRTKPVVNIRGGEITANVGNGGLFHLNGGRVIVSDGKIYANQTSGNVFSVQATDLTISGGEVTGNLNKAGTAAQGLATVANHYSTAVHSSLVLTGDAVTEGAVTVSEKKDVVKAPTINEETGEEIDNTVYADAENTAIVEKLTDNGSVKSTTQIPMGEGVVENKDGSTYVYLNREETFWKEWSGTFNDDVAPGYYKMTGDMTFLGKTRANNGPASVYGVTVIDLNGYTLTAAEGIEQIFNVMKVNDELIGHLTIQDSSEAQTGKVVGPAIPVAGEGEEQATAASTKNGAFAQLSATASFTLESGTIEGFTTTGYGGVLFADGDSVVNINGGKITGNTAERGGAVYVNKNATVNFNGGEVTNNTAKSYAGVIYSGSYTNTINFAGSTISGNTATSDGSVLWSNTVGKVNISDGKITGNFGKTPIVVNGATVTITGGEISGNTNAAGPMTAINLNNYQKTTTATISGNPVIADAGIQVAAARGTEGVEGYIPAPAVTVQELTEGAYVASKAALTVADESVYEMTTDTGYVYVNAEEAQSNPHIGWTSVTGTADFAAGNYILTGDAAIASTVVVEGDLNICLNGYTLTAPEAAQAFNIKSGKVTVCDCSENETGKIQGNGIVASAGAFAQVSGTAAFTLESGEITGFATTGNGGVFDVTDSGTLNLNGGKITNNVAVSAGVVYSGTYDTTINFAGTKISGNEAAGSTNAEGKYTAGQGSVLWGNKVGTVNISGGEITGNLRVIPIVVNGATVTITGGTISGNVNSAGPMVAINLNNYLKTTTATISGNAVIGDKGIQLAAARGTEGEDGYVAPSSATVQNLTEAALIKSATQIPTGEGAVEQAFEGYYVYTLNGDYVETEDPDVPDDHTCTPAEAVKENKKDATCTEAGSYDLVVYCSDPECGKEMSRKTVEVEVLGHTEGEAVVSGNYVTTSCTVCGEEVSSLLNAEKFMARMVLKSDLRFQFGVPTTMMTDWTGVYAVVTKEYADGREAKTVTVVIEDCTIVSPYYAIEFTGVSAKEMCDTVVVQLFDADGQILSTQKTDSIKDYAERTLRKSGTGAESKTQLVDMLNYGAAAQVEFEYAQDNLANRDLTEAEQALATQTVETENKLVKGANYAGSRLILKERIELQIGFNNIDKTCHAEYSYISHSSGETKTVQVAGENFITIGKIVGVAITEPVVADCRNVVTVTVYNADGEVVASAADSVESYANRMSTGGDLFEMIMKFSDSTYATQH